MRFQNIFTMALVVMLLFITLGDRVLPKPLSTASLNTRTVLNNYLIGLFPNKKFRNPNAPLDNTIDQLEQKHQK
ncbi:MAG: hypothetical protein NVSMB70_04310 [Chamaesiphon sp.]